MSAPSQTQQQIRLAVIGASGRMGSEVAALASETGEWKLAVSVSRESAAGFSRSIGALDARTANEVDAVIDFSLPAATVAVADWCKVNKKPLISGVTGIGDSERAALISASRETAVLWAPNMSLGVAAMARMLCVWSKLDGFDFQIEEIHHKQKKDRPSGTALFLQEQLEKAVGSVLPEPIAIRGGGVVGVHRAWAFGEDETIVLEHSAGSRRVFARGALAAARWILKQKPGFYEIADVLGFVAPA